jgi:hypothetical protein
MAVRHHCRMKLAAVSALLAVCQACTQLHGAEPAGAAMTAPAAPATKSIRQWVTCDGRADDTAAAAKAFSAARRHAFTLLVDCPVRLHVGSDIGRPVFIEDGTSVTFSGSGEFIIDNVLQPAFVIANSADVTLTGWSIRYVGSLPADPDTRGFEQGGQFVARAGHFQPAAAFNDMQLSAWLTRNRGVTFDQGQGHVSAVWAGPTNTSSLFFVTGDVARLRVTGMKLYVPADVTADRFIPMAFSFSKNYRGNQVVTAKTPLTAQYVAVPHDLTFSDIDLDGTYMGWQGNLQDATFVHIRSHRYADLQDKDGGQVGGTGKWFAPPHLFYLNYAKDGDPGLFDRRIALRDVIDSGPRIGQARDRGDGGSLSGYATSLKIGGMDIVVDQYRSTRPDGFLDLLASDGVKISNVVATYDSSFLHDLYPGWRFPDSPYRNVTIENVVLTDLAAKTVQRPIGNSGNTSNDHVVLRNIEVRMNHWDGGGSPQPAIAGQHNEVSIRFTGGQQ